MDIEAANIQSDNSETNVVVENIQNQVNSVKLSNSISSRTGRDDKIAMVLKLGAGDPQHHVSTPNSVKDKLEPEPLKKTNA